MVAGRLDAPGAEVIRDISSRESEARGEHCPAFELVRGDVCQPFPQVGALDRAGPTTCRRRARSRHDDQRGNPPPNDPATADHASPLAKPREGFTIASACTMMGVQV